MQPPKGQLTATPNEIMLTVHLRKEGIHAK